MDLRQVLARRRMIVLTEDEQNLLTRLVRNHPVIKIRGTDFNLAIQKYTAWKSITAKFNRLSNSVHQRDTATLKKAWFDMTLPQDSHVSSSSPDSALENLGLQAPPSPAVLLGNQNLFEDAPAFHPFPPFPGNWENDINQNNIHMPSIEPNDEPVMASDSNEASPSNEESTSDSPPVVLRTMNRLVSIRIQKYRIRRDLHKLKTELAPFLGINDPTQLEAALSTLEEPGLSLAQAVVSMEKAINRIVDEQKLRDILSQYGDIISLRVRKGIKAFGGSICYCQYKTPEAVDEAIKHDRIPLDGRPMFLSRYSAKKSKPTFKYSTEEEKNKLFVKNLPFAHCTKDALAEVFDKYGKLKDVRVVTHKDGKPKGLAYIEYEDEAAAAEAVAKVHGMMLADRKLDVAFSAPPPRQPANDAPLLGAAKRDAGGGMRRTQLSSFIPSVLQKAAATASTSQPSTSSASANGSHSNGDEKRPLSNSDFRTLLLKKQ